MIARARASLSAWATQAFATSILVREGARTSRQWQTYAARTVFSACLLGFLLTAMWVASRAPIDRSALAWIGRGIFVAFNVVQQLLIGLLAPTMAASAIAEELDERTADLLALSRLTPSQIVVGKVLSRVGVLALVSLGAMPVMAVVATLGGVSGVEVVATTLHHLVTVALLSFLGAFFALFTRSGLLAMLAADAVAGAMYVAAPPIYAAMVGDPWAGVHLSPLLGSTAVDAWSLLPVLAYLPVIALVLRLSTKLFDLRLAGAGVARTFSLEAWDARRFAIEGGALALALCALPFAVIACWTIRLSPGLGGWLARDTVLLLAQGYIWGWCVAALYVAAWPMLHLAADVIDGVDRLITRSRSRQERSGTPMVWANPVAWYEARPDRWSTIVGPAMFVALIAGIGLMQSGIVVVPGGLVLASAGGTVAGVVLTTWVVTRSIERERLDGTLEVLFTTPLSSSAFLAGKLAGAVLCGVPVLLVTAPGYVLGVVYLDMFVQEHFHWLHVFHGMAVWLWTFPLWLLLVATSMSIAVRTRRLRTAFGTTLGLSVLVLGTPTILARALPSVGFLAGPARVLVPPLAGANTVWEYALGTALMTLAALGVFGVTAARIRSWVAAGAMLLIIGVGTARADDPQDGLVLEAAPLADGVGRAEDWTGVVVRVENRGAADRGTLRLEGHSYAEVPVSFERPIELPEGARKEVTLLVRLSASELGETAVVLDTEGRRHARVGIGWHSVGSTGTAIAVLGDDPLGLNGILETRPQQVPGTRPAERSDDARSVRTGLIAPADAPTHSAGYAGLDWVIWRGADPTRLEPAQVAALGDWVAGGGNLLLTVTDTAPSVRTSPVAAWLPVELGEIDDLPDLDPLLSALGAAPAGPVAVATPQARLRTDRTTWVRALAVDGRPLWISGRFGIGTVHLLLADPRVAPLSSVPREQLWRGLLSLQREAPELPRGLTLALRMDDPPPSCALFTDQPWQSAIDLWTTPLRARLADIPGVAPVPMPWVLTFAAVYLLVIGPLDWFVLRALRRQPWTWVTFPSAIAVFSIAALAGTAVKKGSQAVVRRFELVDQLPDSGVWRGASYLGVFSTRKAEISIAGGFDDGVVVPLETPGFVTEPRVEVGEGAGKLQYHAETWSLGYSRTEWTAPAPGELSVSWQRGAWSIENRLPYAVTDVRVYQAGRAIGGIARLEPGGRGEIREGDPTPPAETLIEQLYPLFAEGPDLGRPHLEGAARPGVVLATLPQSIEPLVISGLEPVVESRSVLRVPVLVRDFASPHLAISSRRVRGNGVDPLPMDAQFRAFSACFESSSPDRDASVALTLAIDGGGSGTVTGEREGDLAECISSAIEAHYFGGGDQPSDYRLELNWTVPSTEGGE